MSKNRYALIRYITIDRCLRQPGERTDWEALAVACGRALRGLGSDDGHPPSERTIKADIAELRSGRLGFKAPILFDRHRKGYIYADPLFSPFGQTVFDAHDLDTLRQALAILRGLDLPPLAANLERLLLRLDAQPPNIGPPAPPEVVHFDRVAAGAKGLEWLPNLYAACREQRALAILYHPFRLERAEYVQVSPYLLRESNKRWFLIGYEHKEGGIRNFALDRVQGISPTTLQTFHRDPAFDPGRWFEHVVGVSLPPGGEPIAVRIRANETRAHYLRTKPLHASQQESERAPDGSAVFSYFLIPNFEWERLMLSFADDVEVLEPAPLRALLAGRFRRAAELNS